MGSRNLIVTNLSNKYLPMAVENLKMFSQIATLLLLIYALAIHYASEMQSEFFLNIEICFLEKSAEVLCLPFSNAMVINESNY